jgi:hypothetical protein
MEEARKELPKVVKLYFLLPHENQSIDKTSFPKMAGKKPQDGPQITRLDASNGRFKKRCVTSNPANARTQSRQSGFVEENALGVGTGSPGTQSARQG